MCCGWLWDEELVSDAAGASSPATLCALLRFAFLLGSALHAWACGFVLRSIVVRRDEVATGGAVLRIDLAQLLG